MACMQQHVMWLLEQDSLTQRVDLNVNSGLSLIIILKICFNKCTTEMQVVNNRGYYGRRQRKRRYMGAFCSVFV